MMNRFHLKSASLLIAMLLSTCVSCSCAPRQGKVAAPLEEGQIAPDFELASSTGEAISLSSQRGKIVVLYFYPKNETPGCTAEACSFRDNIEKFEQIDAVVLGISLDSTDSHEKFVKKNTLNFPLLSDPEGDVHSAYGVWKKNSSRKWALAVDRTTFVIDREGSIRKIWQGVDVVGHADEVLLFATSLP